MKFIMSGKTAKNVYYFSKNRVEGSKEQKSLLGGKGANLHEMCKIGLNVPPGFTITTEACINFMNDCKWPVGLEEEVKAAIVWLEHEMGKSFGDVKNPLLVSVRSGAGVSMPGMMDTVLNLGLNEATVEGLAKLTNNRRFALDSFRRFIAMFGDVVLKIRAEKGEMDPFDEIMEHAKKTKGKTLDTELTENDLEEIIEKYRDIIKKYTGKDFPQDPWEQLKLAIDAVFESWMNERAIEYRRIYNIPEDSGTAVNVQAMVFGNMGEDCGTGVAFTRDPATGENIFYGEFLFNAQGEDVVAGIRTPQKIVELHKEMPEMYDELLAIRNKLEQHYKDMQDIEFTIEKGKMYILQCRNGKRTGIAAINIAFDMLMEDLIGDKEAIMRIEANQVTMLLRPIFNDAAKKAAQKEGRLLATGLAAGPGAACGKVCFYSDEVEQRKKEWGADIILCRIETSPEDIKGMEEAIGILTARGGITSHAALVARQRGKVCVAGCSAIDIDYKKRQMVIAGKTIKEGDFISIDGSTSEVFLGKIDVAPSEVMQVLIHKTKKPEESLSYQKFERLMSIADQYRTLGVRTNADAPNEAEMAVAFGAEGIGLTRTEHMFFEGNRIISMRKMILATNEADRRKALEELLPYQRDDFAGIFRAMKGRPVTIRALDPPLHEFLPHTEADQKALAAETGIPVERIRARVAELHEFNPMLGHRGCRLGIAYPEITEMQVRAIIEAACRVKKEGIDVHPEIMIPLVGHVNELRDQKAVVHKIADEVMKKENIKIEYMVGTMIELPRAAVTADKIAEEAEFFSFGTNDLTQTGFGISRDDYGTFMPIYIAKGILKVDPFVSLDEGIFELIKIAVERGRKTRKDIKLGICGEHGGDPASIKLCHKAGLTYVSCSPYRVPVARVAAAQAALERNGKE